MPDQPKRRWPRLTIRGIMALVVLVAVGLYLGLAAVEVYRDKEPHVHTGVVTLKGSPSLTVIGGCETPFWPRYWRHVLGRSWRKQPLCGRVPDVEAELCEFAHPEMGMKIGGQMAYHNSSEQMTRLIQIEERLAAERSKVK